MNIKKSAILNGILIRPLLIGGRALILHCGQVIRTAPIVMIHDCGAGKIRFETASTNYTLLTDPDPQTAASAFQLGLAA